MTHARLDGGPGLQYPVPDAAHPGTDFLFDDRFPTPDGRARMVPVEFLPPAEPGLLEGRGPRGAFLDEVEQERAVFERVSAVASDARRRDEAMRGHR